MTKAPPVCPCCGVPARIEVQGPGSASCAACGGLFTPVAGVFAALRRAGIDGGKLKEILDREGKKLSQCVICAGQFTTFPILGEQLHACVPCQAIFLDKGALDRLAQKSVPGRGPARTTTGAAALTDPPAPPPLGPPPIGRVPSMPFLLISSAEPAPLVVMTAAPALPAAPAAATPAQSPPPLRPDPRGLSRLAVLPLSALPPAPPLMPPPPPMTSPPLATQASEPSAGRASLDPSMPLAGARKAAVAPARARVPSERAPMTGTAGQRVAVVLLLLVAACFIYLSIKKPQTTPLGGGKVASFHGIHVASEPVALGTLTASKLSSTQQGGEFMAWFIPGGGSADASRSELLLLELLGKDLRIDGPPRQMGALAVISADVTISGRTGRVRALFSEQDAWILAATSTVQDFGRGREAQRFFSSFASE